MGEHVMHFPGQPLAFGQSGRPCLRRPGALQLDQEPFGLVVSLPERADVTPGKPTIAMALSSARVGECG